MEKHYLIKQYENRSVGRGRENDLQYNHTRSMIRYRAPNGIIFYIDCRGIGPYSPPTIRSSYAEPYDESESTHTLGNGRVCLAVNIRGWDLDKILIYCDSWAKGIRMYERTGHFPKTPAAVFQSR